MLQKIGYSHINSSNTEIKFWGNNLGVDFAIPSRVILENGDIVEAVSPYISFNDGSMVVERWIESNPTTEIDVKVGETIEFRDDKIVVVYNYDLPDIESLKEHIKSKVATKRWQQEIVGLTINDISYATDRESQTKYTAVAVAISQANPATWSINWKTNGGAFITLNAEEMSVIINDILQYIQDCFNKEYELQQQIDECTTIEQIMAIDYNTGWPSDNI